MITGVDKTCIAVVPRRDVCLCGRLATLDSLIAPSGILPATSRGGSSLLDHAYAEVAVTEAMIAQERVHKEDSRVDGHLE